MGDLHTLTKDSSIVDTTAISSLASTLYNKYNELGLRDKRITFADFDEYFKNRVESNALSIALGKINEEKKDKATQITENNQ